MSCNTTQFTIQMDCIKEITGDTANEKRTKRASKTLSPLRSSAVGRPRRIAKPRIQPKHAPIIFSLSTVGQQRLRRFQCYRQIALRFAAVYWGSRYEFLRFALADEGCCVCSALIDRMWSAMRSLIATSALLNLPFYYIIFLTAEVAYVLCSMHCDIVLTIVPLARAV